jgi:hypothetical protein
VLIGIAQPPRQLEKIEHPRLRSARPTFAIICKPSVMDVVGEFILLGCVTKGEK